MQGVFSGIGAAISGRPFERIALADVERRIIEHEPGVRRLPAHEQALDRERIAELKVMIDARLAGAGAEPGQPIVADLGRPDEAALGRADVPAKLSSPYWPATSGCRRTG